MLKLKINNKKIKVKKNSLLINIINKLGIYIPHFCYHKKLSISANCRMCLVEIENENKLFPSCATRINKNIKVFTNSKKVIQARKDIMELLLINHPLDCPICDKGGECELQNFSIQYGKVISKFKEKKKISIYHNISKFISLKEINRCIYCTRCVRFGEEICGIKELGLINKGEYSQITTFFKKKINSKISGNMIDLCPVGALTSKMFRYKIRTWELYKKKSISIHDGLGTNLKIEIKNNKIMRVLPFKNKNINEYWISDKDRFSYLGLNHKNRLNKPMIKIKGIWKNITWKIALKFIKKKLEFIFKKYNNKNNLAILATPYSTLEELFLLKKILKCKKSKNIDFRLRQCNFLLNHNIKPWLGTSISNFLKCKNILLIGCYLSEDNPIIAARLRKFVKNGTKINLINSIDIDLNMKIYNKIITSPINWVKKLIEILLVILINNKENIPKKFKKIKISKISKNIAYSLINNKKNGIFIGNYVTYYKDLSKIHKILQLIANKTNSKFGYIIESSNLVGGYFVNAISKNKKINTKNILKNKYKSYILFNSELNSDFYNTKHLKKSLKNSIINIFFSSYKHSLNYANILLPISTFIENSGTFINMEGKIQKIKPIVKSLNNSLPGWKILCILANYLNFNFFNYKNSKEIFNEIIKKKKFNFLNNLCKLKLHNILNYYKKKKKKIILIIYIPYYYSDSIAKRSYILLDKKKKYFIARISLNLSKQIKIKNFDLINIIIGKKKFLFKCYIDKKLCNNLVSISIECFKKYSLLGIFNNILIEKKNK